MDSVEHTTSPHSRLRRQYGVMQVVTAHAVNVTGCQMVTAVDCRGVPSKMVRLGLTQIDLIIQIYYFLCGFCDFCEILFFLSQIAQMPQKGAERGSITSAEGA